VGLDATTGVEPEGRAARQREAIHALSRVGEIEHGVLAGARPTAADVDCGNGRLLEDDGGDAGGQLCVMGVADANAGDISKKVLQGDKSVGSLSRVETASTITTKSELLERHDYSNAFFFGNRNVARPFMLDCRRAVARAARDLKT